MRETHRWPDHPYHSWSLVSFASSTVDLLTAPLTTHSIPLGIALIVLYYIHQRSRKRQRIEEANDPHKSLDFGVEISQPDPARSKSKKKFGRSAPEMASAAGPAGEFRPNMKSRGLSMDMNMDSPYLLPAALNGSRDSLHSMSRAVGGQHDPYRPVNMMRSSQDTTRSPRPMHEGASAYSASTTRTGDQTTLIGNASHMPHSPSLAKRGESMASTDTRPSLPSNAVFLSRQFSRTSSDQQTLGHIGDGSAAGRNGAPPPLPPLPPSHFQGPSPPLASASPPLMTASPPPMTSSPQHMDHPGERPSHTHEPSVAPRPPRKSSMAASAHRMADQHMSATSFYGEDDPPPPLPKFDAPPVINVPSVVQPDDTPYDIDPSMIYTGRFSIDNSAPSQTLPVADHRASTFGVRPLPPDHPEENAEQRANRIRSFYKEYFDDSKPHTAEGGYYEDNDYYADGAIYDPSTGEFVMPSAPFAQPVGRRAMTPPPRSGPRGPGGDHARHFSTMSGSRARGRAPPPKKMLPPPKALTSLPTPHLLREDTALILNPIDFAPPTSFREAQNGRRPDSPMGTARPYSPSVKPFSPLVPAFDELSAMPSPHALRKSGTFTSLDFAPPRFRPQGDSGSDAGSIRSARSGISAMQMGAVRAGAYRVSRIPREMVTTKDDLAAQLRPRMDLVSRA